MISEMLILISP